MDVEEGTVIVQHALLPTSKDATLHAGESIRVEKTVPIASAGLDKSTLAKYILQIAREIAVTLGGRGYKINLPGGGGGGAPGESCKAGVPGCPGSAPPAPPPLPPPPPPIN